MRAAEARLHHVALGATAATGAVYGVLKYFVPPQSPDSRLAVPWQPAVLSAHVLAAPFLLFALGLLFREHALERLSSGERRGRASGKSLLALAAPVVLTGYLVQAFPATAKVVGWTHAAAGTIFALAWVAHALKRSS